ncbi:MAG TPA: hypothetical protein PK637_11060 [Flavobacteriales bacterium]|nr:hypothetical protein [Flavobacteriales bacterium]
MLTKMRMLELITLTFLLLVTNNGFAQPDTLNKLNSNGQKHGYWKRFLNEEMDPVKNIQDAYFYGYELWNNGKELFKFYKHKLGHNKFVYVGEQTTKGNPIPVNGTFTWYYNNLIISTEIFSKGLPVYFKWCDWKNKKKNPKSTLCQVQFFDRMYNEIRGTYYYKEH